MIAPSKVVLVSRSGYDRSHDGLLQSLIERRIILFCAVGRDCRTWEDVMDELCVGLIGDGTWYVVTTSHPDESIEEVVAFAEQWHLDQPSSVEIIEV